MELKEILAFAKKLWWLVVLLTVGSFFAAYMLHGKLSARQGSTTYVVSGSFELPRDMQRTVSIGASGAPKIIPIDSNTELQMPKSDSNVLSTGRYYTILDVLLRRRVAAMKQKEGASDLYPTEESWLMGAYASKEFQNTLEALRPAHLGAQREKSGAFPESYIPGFSLTADEQAEWAAQLQWKAEDGPLLTAIAERNAKLFDKNIPLTFKREETSRVVTVTLSSVSTAIAARLWADSVLLAAVRESYRRVLALVEEVRMSATGPDKGEENLSAEEMQALDLQAHGVIQAVKERADALAKVLDGELAVDAFKPDGGIQFPDFGSDEAAVMRKNTFFNKLASLIRTSWPNVVQDYQTRTPVGQFEREQHAQALDRLQGDERRRSAISRILENEFRFEQMLLDNEQGKFLSYKIAGNPQAYIPNRAVIWSPEMEQARQEILTLQKEREELNQSYKPEAAPMKRNARMFQVAVDRWVSVVETDFLRREKELEARETTLKGEQRNLDADITREKGQARDLRVLLYTLGAVANVYSQAQDELTTTAKTMGERRKYRADIDRAGAEQTPVIRVFRFSSDPKAVTTGTGSVQVAAVVALIVLVGSVVMMYVLMLARNKITTEYDVRRHINLPVLSKLARRPAVERSLLTVSQRSSAAEAFSTLATLVRSYAKELSLRTILVTSAVKEEGKTDIACNLSIALARKGLKVLAIDADYHRARVGSFFGVTATKGVVQLAAIPGEKDIAAYVTPSGAEGLDLLLAGGEVADPVRLMESEGYREILKKAESEYDLVIFDSPPVVRVGDALILASEVDATVMVVSSGAVTFADAALAKRLLTNVQANLLGVVINNSKTERAREYYNYYYGGTRRRVRKVPD